MEETVQPIKTASMFLHLPVREKYQRGSERDFLIQSFTDALNRDLGGRKPYKPSTIAFKLSHLKIDDLRWFYHMCDKAPVFGRHFWWSLKSKS